MMKFSGTNNSYVDEIIGFSIIIILLIVFQPILMLSGQVWIVVVVILVAMVLGGVLSMVVAEVLDLSNRSILRLISPQFLKCSSSSTSFWRTTFSRF